MPAEVAAMSADTSMKDISPPVASSKNRDAAAGGRDASSTTSHSAGVPAPPPAATAAGGDGDDDADADGDGEEATPAPIPSGQSDSTAAIAAAAAAAAAAASGQPSEAADSTAKKGKATGGLPLTRVYLATYSNVPVYELTVRGIAVMRRRADGFLNATQILKVAGIEKGRRTKILEKEILTGEHEKVQGGYGKYQGTWIPLRRAKELSETYNVAHLLAPVLDFDPSTAGSLTTAPKGKRPNPNAPAAQRLALGNKAKAVTGSATLDGTSQQLTSEADSLPAPNSPSARSTSPFGIVDGAAAAAPSSNAAAATAAEVVDDSSTTSKVPKTTIINGTSVGATPSNGTIMGGPSQHPRFLRLRPPPAATAPAASLSGTGSGAINDPALLPGTDSAAAADEATSDADDQRSNDIFSPNKRPRLADGSSPATGAQGEDGDVSMQDANSSIQLGISPVKDLNNLGPAGGSLRAAASAGRGGSVLGTPATNASVSAATAAASHSRSARIILGPPDELAKDRSGTVRYADRAQAFKGADESQERKIKEILANLFLLEGEGEGGDEGAAEKEKERDAAEGESEEDKLKHLLGRMSAAISLGGPSSTGAYNPENSNVSANVIIDDHGHAPLHWAAALSKISLVKMLLARPPEAGGANVHAGNFAGETALHRSVLVTNSYETGDFPELLSLLKDSISTRDYKRRTILHHIAMVAALRGRAASARYYLACVLEHIAQQQREAREAAAAGIRGVSVVSTSVRAAALINAQDEDGETALGIVARIGNASMIRMLLEVGARKDLVNHFGIRAADWGIDHHLVLKASKSTEESPPTAKSTAAEKVDDVVQALTRPHKQPTQKSDDLLKEIDGSISDLKQIFQREIDQKERQLTAAQGKLKEATRQLSSRRSQLTATQEEVAKREEMRHSISNLKRMIAILREGVSPANESWVQRNLAPVEAPAGSSGANELVRLRWLNMWTSKSCTALENRMASLAEEAKKKEAQCRQVVAMCCGIPEERVVEILDDLVIAVESDGAEMDLTRVAGFLSRIP